LHLKSFRSGHGETKIKIPTLHGYSHVSCANYFWEILAWTVFGICT
jgi:hypothetical protein